MWHLVGYGCFNMDLSGATRRTSTGACDASTRAIPHPPPPMRNLLVCFQLIACAALHAEIEVTFPPQEIPLQFQDVPAQESVNPLTEGSVDYQLAEFSRIYLEYLAAGRELRFYPRIASFAKSTQLPKPIWFDDLLAAYARDFYTGAPRSSAADFDKIRDGMTAREMVSLLGPGTMDRRSGVGFLCWFCEDGRILQVLPQFDPDVPEKLSILSNGDGQNHAKVVSRAKQLIASLKVIGQKVEVVLTADTPQAKAGVAQTLEVGGTFQVIEPLPRLDVTIERIDGDAIHCYYNYIAAPEGIIHRHETGKMVLRPDTH